MSLSDYEDAVQGPWLEYGTSGFQSKGDINEHELKFICSAEDNACGFMVELQLGFQ
jgi:hypothetical protein